MNNEIHNNIEETEKLLNSINTDDSIQFSEWTKEKIFNIGFLLFLLVLIPRTMHMVKKIALALRKNTSIDNI